MSRPIDEPQYIPVFPFYEAEPTWFYKGYGTSGGDGGSGGDDEPTHERPIVGQAIVGSARLTE